jgi:transcriptional regulator with XRE-family HTH domain
MIDLRTTREQLRLSRREAGSVLGLAESQIYNIEAGIRKNSEAVNANTAHQLANRLKPAKGEQRCNCCGRIRPKSDFQIKLTSLKRRCKNCRNGVQLYEGMKISWSQMIKMELPHQSKVKVAAAKRLEGGQMPDYPIVMHLALRKHGWGRHETAARLGVALHAVKEFVQKNWLADSGRVYKKQDPDERCMSIGEAHIAMWSEHKRELAAANIEWSKHEEAMRWYWRDRYKDINTKVKHRLRKAIRQAIVAKGATKRVCLSIGCSVKDLRAYLEARFAEGMTWGNYGSEWHIDHVKPLDSFNLHTKRGQLEANHYTNLQPLWASDNLSKGNRIWKQQKLF